MKLRTFHLSIIIFSLFSSYLHGQTNIDKAFGDLEKEIGGCQADLQSKNAMIGKATSELQRLDGLVTALKNDIGKKDKQNEQLREQVTSSDAKIVSLQAISNNAKACGDKNAKATQNLTAAVAANNTMKNQLELSTKKNSELIAQNQKLQQQLIASNNELSKLKNTATTKPSNSADIDKMLTLEKNKNQQLNQKIAQLQQQLLASNNQPAKLKTASVVASTKPAEAEHVLSEVKAISETLNKPVEEKALSARVIESANSFNFEYLGCKYSQNSATCELRITNEGNDSNFSLLNHTRAIFSNGEVINISVAKMANSSNNYSSRSIFTHFIVKKVPVLAVLTFKGLNGENTKIFGLDISGKKGHDALNVSFRNLL